MVNFNTVFELKSEKLLELAKLMTPSAIKNIRRKFGVTQVSFADLLDVSYHTYKNWEIGHRKPCTSSVALLMLADQNPDIFINKRKNFIKLVAKLRNVL